MMTRRAHDWPNDRGFILATVLLFLVVLTLTSFLGAALTRSDVQVVNNLGNEKEALTLAEAGVHEALYRLSLASGDQASVPGINGGAAFTASITPQSGNSWAMRILNTTAGPAVVSGTAPNQILSAPTLQPFTTQLTYTNNGSGNATNPLSQTLTVEWDTCTSTTGPGCSGYVAGGDTRRKLPESVPVANRRPVVKILSTGRSGDARQTLVVKAIDCVPDGGCKDGSVCTMNSGCGNDNSVGLNGSNTITAAGSVNINAGATSNPPSSCTAAATGGGATIQAGGEINVVGDATGNFTPAANEGVKPVVDPYLTMNPPCYTGSSTPCTNPSTTLTTQGPGTAASPQALVVTGSNVTLQPGIYYGGIQIKGATNVTLSSGVYVMAGGGFGVSNNSQNINSGTGGVMIYNTSNGANAAGSLNLVNGNISPSFAAITNSTDPYHGVVFFQDRTLTPQPEIYVQGGSGRTLDGLVYAPSATFVTQGNNTVNLGGTLIVGSIKMVGSSGLNIQAGTTIPTDPICGGIAYRPVGWQDF